MLSRQEIELAYRLILGREADPSGLAHYEKLSTQGLDLAGLRATFLSSPEFATSPETSRERIVDMGHAKVVVDSTEPEFGRHIAAHKGWEPHITALIQQNLQRGDTYVDVGANVGVMAFTAAAAVGPSGRVIGFEPHPDNIRHFLAGVAVNDFHNVVLHGFALSDVETVFSLIGTSNGYLMPTGASVFQTIAVPGDPILAAEERIDLLKIDVEGHEPQVLAGLDHALRKHRPTILAEYNPRCLRDHVGCPPPEFARQLFRLTDAIEVIEHDGQRVGVASPGELTDLWERKNADAVETGFLPDGMLHFDLLFRVS